MLYDISQEVLSSSVWPGDPAPRLEPLGRMAGGAVCNLSGLSMCVHNGTHIDAPFHFYREGDTVERMPLAAFVGDCYLSRHRGDVTAEDAAAILEQAEAAGAAKRILLGGCLTVTAEAARVFAKAGIWLLGNESQTVGPEDGPMEVHLILLGARVALLEGIVLTDIPQGKYFLSAAPLKLAGSDGAPCRAWIMG